MKKIIWIIMAIITATLAMGGFLDLVEDPYNTRLASNVIDIGSTEFIWNIQKTGAERYLDVKIVNINDTATQVCLSPNNLEAFQNSRTISERRYFPVNRLATNLDYSISMDSLDLMEIDTRQQCILIEYKELRAGFSVKLGTQSIIINSSESFAGMGGNAPENIYQGSDGTLYVGYEGADNRVKFAWSDDTGDTWNINTVYTPTTANYVNIVMLSNDTIYLLWENASKDIVAAHSDDNGATWDIFKAFTPAGSENYKDVSCEVDSNDIIHCAIIESDKDALWYGNSSLWDNELSVNANTADDTDYINLAIAEDDCIYIVGAGTDQYDIDIWSPCLNGWGSANRIEVHAGISLYPTMAAAPNGNLYIAWDESPGVLWFANSSDGGQTWNKSLVDAKGEYGKGSVAVGKDNQIYLVMDNVTGISTDNLIIYNSTDFGQTWNRTIYEVNATSPKAADTRFPTTNRLGTILHYVTGAYEGGANKIYYGNITVNKSVQPAAPDTCTYGGSGIWEIACSDTCTISSDVDLNNNNVIMSGLGHVILEAELINAPKIYVLEGCKLYKTG